MYSEYYNCGMVPVIILGAALLAMILVVVAAVKTWIYCMVFHKAGYSWAWGLLILVPVANVIIPFVLALGDWPVRRELRRLKQQPPATAVQPA